MRHGCTLTDPSCRHNVEVTEVAFVHAEGRCREAFMHFDLVDLQLFVAVADSRSITGGADRAHLALASASARIKGLEEAFAVPLFKRGRRGVELTAPGGSLLHRAPLV